MFEKLSDEVLKDIFIQNDEELLEYLKTNQIDIDGSLHHFKDHAFGEFWIRYLKNRKVSQKEIDYLTSFKENYTIDFLIGEIARDRLLEDNNYSALKDHVEKDEWAYNQIIARVKVESTKLLLEKNQKLDNDLLTDLFNSFVNLNITWAIEEMLSYCGDEFLVKFIEDIYKKKSFSKRNRHIIKEDIRKELQKRDSKIKLS